MKPKKITPELKQQIAEVLPTMKRKEVMRKFGVSYAQLRAEFGSKWKHTDGEVVAEVVAN